MISKTITMEPEKLKILLDTIRGFAERRDHILREEVKGPKHTFAIYDRDVQSGILFNSLEMFVGNSLIPERIRLKGTIFRTRTGLEVTVRGDVIMNEYNTVNDRSRRRDALRCKALFEVFIDKITSI